MPQYQAAKKDYKCFIGLRVVKSAASDRPSERLGRDEATITRWVRKYKDEGKRGLLEVKHAPGKAPSISGSDLERLEKRLQESSGFQSYGQIQQWLKSELGLSLAYKTVYEVVRSRLGAKLKVPRPQSTKQHPESLSHFKKTASSIQILPGGIWSGETIKVPVPG